MLAVTTSRRGRTIRGRQIIQSPADNPPLGGLSQLLTRDKFVYAVVRVVESAAA